MSRFTFLGRLVQGSATENPQRIDNKTKQKKVRPNGEPDSPFYVAVAIEKNPANRFLIDGVPSYESQKELIDADARAAWPQYFGQRPQGPVYGAHLAPDCTNPKFANKVIDGDGFDENGKAYNLNEGWAGCWVVKCSTYFAPQVQEWRDDQVDARGATLPAGWFDCAKTGRKIKLGDYVSISGTCDNNKSTESPGMYMNLDLVAFEKEGELIVSRSAVDVNAALGSRGGPSAGSAGAASSSNTAHGGQTSGTASGGTSYSGYRTGVTGGDDTPPPPAATDETPPPPPAGPQMTAKANGKSFQDFVAKGWTEAQLREHGYVA